MEHIVYQDMAVPVEKVTTTEVTQEVPVERVVERVMASVQRRDPDSELLRSYNQTRADAAAARHRAYDEASRNGGGGGHRANGAPGSILDLD